MSFAENYAKGRDKFKLGEAKKVDEAWGESREAFNESKKAFEAALGFDSERDDVKSSIKACYDNLVFIGSKSNDFDLMIATYALMAEDDIYSAAEKEAHNKAKASSENVKLLLDPAAKLAEVQVEAIQDENMVMKYWFDMSHAALKKEKFAEAKNHVAKAKEALENVSDDKVKFTEHFAKLEGEVKFAILQDEFTKAFDAANKAKSLEVPNYEAAEGQYKDAITKAKEARECTGADKKTWNGNLEIVYLNLAFVLSQQGKHQYALDCHEKARGDDLFADGDQKVAADRQLAAITHSDLKAKVESNKLDGINPTKITDDGLKYQYYLTKAKLKLTPENVKEAINGVTDEQRKDMTSHLTDLVFVEFEKEGVLDLDNFFAAGISHERIVTILSNLHGTEEEKTAVKDNLEAHDVTLVYNDGKDQPLMKALVACGNAEFQAEVKLMAESWNLNLEA